MLDNEEFCLICHLFVNEVTLMRLLKDQMSPPLYGHRLATCEHWRLKGTLS